LPWFCGEEFAAFQAAGEEEEVRAAATKLYAVLRGAASQAPKTQQETLFALLEETRALRADFGAAVATQGVLVEAVEGLQRAVVGLMGEKGSGNGGGGGNRIRVGRVTKEKGKKKKVVVDEEAITNPYGLVEEEDEEVLAGPVSDGART
jgi:hypothetical protein